MLSTRAQARWQRLARLTPSLRALARGRRARSPSRANRASSMPPSVAPGIEKPEGRRRLVHILQHLAGRRARAPPCCSQPRLRHQVAEGERRGQGSWLPRAGAPGPRPASGPPASCGRRPGDAAVSSISQRSCSAVVGRDRASAGCLAHIDPETPGIEARIELLADVARRRVQFDLLDMERRLAAIPPVPAPAALPTAPPCAECRGGPPPPAGGDITVQAGAAVEAEQRGSRYGSPSPPIR